MSAVDRLRAAMSALDTATREQQEQRDLRERHVAEAKATAMKTMERDAAVHGKYMEHMQELAKRHKESGGWLTEKALADRSHTMQFGPEDEEKPADQFGQYARGASAQRDVTAPPPPIAPSVPGVPGDLPSSYAPPAPAEQAPPAPEPASPPPSARRRGRHARSDAFDDDDFSNNSWMVD
ncbi:hypothetical protein [Amycolatopsis samaneae]|uniref:Translation initiation factor IF-2 n=1 Tax=Amycolatopsis samaneae TaxID=664691 RepID=A0ABW5GGZ2_9PSEU